MPLIELTTEIKSPIEICFDLARSIDLHKISTASTNEQAIEGRTTGLIELNETVTWEAIHIGLKQRLTSKITAYKQPTYFVDEQIKGPFKSIYHEHKFERKEDITIMTDSFLFTSPFGPFGQVFNYLFLTNYLKTFLVSRNEIIREYAETDKWKIVLE